MNTERNWSGYWINSGRGMGTPTTATPAAPYLRTTFECKSTPGKATVFLCGLGWHELYVNGRKADDRVLAPVATQFDRHVSWIEYDITPFVRPGKNAVAVLLGNGWYNCQTAEVWSFDKAPWRDLPKLICDIEIDGVTIAKSDTSWKTHDSPVTFDALRNGEFYDARLEIPGFADPDLDDSSWKNAAQCNPPGGRIVKEELEPCKVMKHYSAIAAKHLDSNATIYDFGTNLTGWCRIKIKGPAGTRIKIVYSEHVRPVSGDIDREYIAMFVKSGEFQTDEYILKGSEEPEIYEPRFTYHGFRYAKVYQWDGRAKLLDIQACFVRNSFRQTGEFESSDRILNALQRNTVQSYLSNFTGIPTDCPHREKNGWTGDAQLAMETGLWNFDCEKACSHFLQIVADTQRPSGQLPGIAPSGGWGYNWGSGPAWDSILFEYPWRMYLFRGNTENIRRHYQAMKLYLEYCAGMAENHLVRFGLGDWCHHDRRRIAPIELTSSAYYYYDVTRMVEFANILGKENDAKGYTELAEQIRENFNRKFNNGDGTYADGSWTALAAALYFHLAEETDRARIAEKLVGMVRANGHKTDFGILGAKYVPRVLADCGYADDAFHLITQTQFPGWGFWIENGATSLWEQWNGTSSQNHIMFGDISAWMFEYLGGAVPLKETPGFKHFLLKPALIPSLSHVRMRHETPFGTLRSEWKRENGKIQCEFEIPQGTSADILLPGSTVENAEGIQKFLL